MATGDSSTGSSTTGLIGHWDPRVFVSVTVEATLERAQTRDLALLGTAAEVEKRYVIVHNDQLDGPAWEARPR